MRSPRPIGRAPSRRASFRAPAWSFARGETTSLAGVSGSGKSTLISLLAGLMLPEAGKVVFDGEDITDLDDFARARLRARRIGVVLQSDNLIPFLTAVENVELAIELAGGERPGARARELLSELGLARRLDHLPRRLSGGETQRVSVAVAMANEPDLLLPDEVTDELDSSSAEQVLGVIFDAWRERGLTVLFVTRDAPGRGDRGAGGAGAGGGAGVRADRHRHLAPPEADRGAA